MSDTHRNCCQTILGALAARGELDDELALRLGTCFGGGMMCGEVCGAISGSMMYIGLKYGDTPEAKQHGRELLGIFRETFGSGVCRDLLDPVSGKKNCTAMIEKTAELLHRQEELWDKAQK